MRDAILRAMSQRNMYRVLEDQSVPARVAELERRGTVVGPGTSLPVSPVDGDQFIYKSGDTIWEFRWVAADSLWRFIGGTPLVSEVAAGVTPAAGQVWGAASGGPSVTLPFAGAYDIRHGCQVTNAGTNVAEITWQGVKLGAAAAADAESVNFGHPASGATQSTPMAAAFRRTGLAAAAALAVWVKSVNAQDSVSNRFLWVLPVSVHV